MKKTMTIALTLAVVLTATIASAASAHMWGGRWGNDGWSGVPGIEYRKAFDATADLRKELDSRMFDLREAYRAGDEAKADALEKSIFELRKKIYETSKGLLGGGPGYAMGYGRGGRGYCGGPGYGMMGGYGY